MSHKNAPGAISAMAFEVNPVRPSVALVVGFSFDDMSFSFLDLWIEKGPRRPGKTTKAQNKKSPRPGKSGSKTSQSFRSALRCVELRFL
ncbi:MAG: hypothetical protein DMG11_14820 [Acidobacteria bacterium]|nr:MAG: hypothetical protein DMG11_14820 [Acidobacteriota bacterium]